MPISALLIPALWRVTLYILGLLVAYGVAIGAVFLFVATPGLVDMVSACKIVSLILLIYANREIPHSIDLERNADIQNANFLIVLMSIVVLVMMVVKTIVQDYSLLDTPERGKEVLSFFFRNSYWISALPIFAYFLLDLFIAFFREGSPNDRRVAVEFVLFRDLVCAFPLALVLLLTEAYRAFSPIPEAAAHAELFFGGAIAVILLSSAISTRALDLLQTRRRERGATGIATLPA